jgi:hypothetical protein
LLIGKNLIVGKYWYQSFRARHPEIVLRVPERVSIARLLAFNQENVQKFYEKLKEILLTHPELADKSRVYNVDETGVTTVSSKSSKVLAPVGSKEVSTVSSAERGPLITACCFVSASGNQIPPAIIFPRVNFTPNMLIDGIPGTLGLANQSGWMTKELFLRVLEHFVKFTQSSQSKPTSSAELTYLRSVCSFICYSLLFHF